MEWELRNLNVKDLRSEIQRTLDELKSDPALRAMATQANLDLDEIDRVLATTGKDKLIEVESRGAGLDPATTAVIVAFAPVAAKIVRDIWDHVILPRIRKDHGSNTLSPKS